MADPLISVVVPTYGRPEYLAEALESIKAQSYTRWEVIVVDDCSPEPVTVPEWVTLVRHRRNMGSGAARNTGLAHANGDLVTFLDDDDWFHPDRFQWAVDELGEARTHVCLTSFVVGGEPSAPYGYDFYGNREADVRLGMHLLIGSAVHRAEDVVPFSPTLRAAEDVEWWYRMAHAADFALHSEVGFFYRRHDDGRRSVSRVNRYLDAADSYRQHISWFNREQAATAARRVSKLAADAGRRADAVMWACRSFAHRPSATAAKIVAHRTLR